jgi:DNA repair protein RadC
MAEGPSHNANLITVRERMLRLGPNALSANELLALVLGTGHANRAMELAERLYGQCGGLVGIAQLGLVELGEVGGVGLAKAAQLQAALDLGERLKLEIVIADRPCIRTPADAAALFMPEMSLLEQEHLRALLLDNRSRVVAIQDIYRGNYNSISLHPGDVFREAVRRNSSAIIVAHNHVSGLPDPSAEDLGATKLLVAAGKVLGIDLVDRAP